MRLILTSAALLGVCAAPAAPLAAGAEGGPPSARVERAAAPFAGTVEGTVRLSAAEASAPAMLSPYARRRYSPPAAASGRAATAEDVVVYVIADRASPAGAPREVSVSQREMRIAPHVTPVQAGTRVHFPNEDDVFHNIFSLSSTHPFNLGRYARGQSRSEIFARAGVVRLFCDIHSDMSGVVLVLDTPHFTRADASGRFRITGLPAGRHRVVAWHESAGADTVTVTVPASGAVTANFRLPG